MSAEDWQALVKEYQAIVERETGAPFLQEPNDQLWGAVGAVFASWESDRAKVYRRLNSIPAEWGTAVNVQAMVFVKHPERPLGAWHAGFVRWFFVDRNPAGGHRSEEHTSELQSLMRISYDVFSLKKKTKIVDIQARNLIKTTISIN